MSKLDEMARKIYAQMPYDGPSGTAKPAWVPGGNSLKQDKAREYVRAALSALMEPSEAMLAAGEGRMDMICPEGSPSPNTAAGRQQQLKIGYQAMLQAVETDDE